MIKSRENAKKQVFPAYVRHFGPEKYVNWKSGFHILGMVSAHFSGAPIEAWCPQELGPLENCFELGTPIQPMIFWIDSDTLFFCHV